jgi:glyoxylase-like metal-dependent hydrolase (beta-lactamase superfamily II)
MSEIPFLKTHDVPAGQIDQLAPDLIRVQGDNPGPFTFTGTGVFILGAGERVMVIDPGPDSPAHRAALLKVLDGRTVSHILITHHHLDHTAIVPWLAARFGAQTCGFGKPSRMESGCEDDSRLEAGDDCSFAPDRELSDGEMIQGDGFVVEALHTPGHASNHMCYAFGEALFCGDHVMSWSTSVVSPPDGHMGDYVAQLERIRDRDFRVLYPTHGQELRQPRAFLDAYIGHRKIRHAQVLDCVRGGVSEIRTIVARLYPNLDRKLIPAACHSVLAHLITLREEGEVEGDRDDGLRCHYAPRCAEAAE